MELPVKNVKGKVVGTANLSDAVFGVPMNSAVVHQAMVMYESNQRQGTHDTKTRAEVSGGGRKPWPQKHTGRARQGSIRSPQWRGGGVVFGPHPRDHGVDMPRRMRRLALKCVLSEKVRQDKVIILNELSFKSPSTKNMADILNKLGVASSALIVTGEPQENMVRSTRNLQRVWTSPVSVLNAGQLLKRDSVILTVDAVKIAEQLWAKDSINRTSTKKASAGNDKSAQSQGQERAES